MTCTQREVEQCHYTYVTTFSPSQEEICDETFEKQCSITFQTQAHNETVRKCHVPVEKVCSGRGPERCTTVYETSCSTRYSKDGAGEAVGETKCERRPLKLCGAGCVYEEGREECRDELVAAVIEVPREVCDLLPHKTCRLATKLVPQLKPVPQCSSVPRQSCRVIHAPRRRKTRTVRSRWCLAPSATPAPHPVPHPAVHSALARSHGLPRRTNTHGPSPAVAVFTQHLGPQPQLHQAPRYQEPGVGHQEFQEDIPFLGIPFVGTYGVSPMLSDNVRDHRDHMMSLRDHMMGPRNQMMVPRDHMMGPRDNSMGPRDHMMGPRDHMMAASDDMMVPTDHMDWPIGPMLRLEDNSVDNFYSNSQLSLDSNMHF
jgi:hypothetical protein